MKMSYSITVTCAFSVEYYESNEGGMDYGSHGEPVDSLPAAVEIWREAMRLHPNRDWMIVTTPHVEVK